MRTREEILKTLDDAHTKTMGGPGQGEISKQQRDVTVEILLDIRDGVNRMLDSGMYESRTAYDPNQFEKPS